MPFEIDLWGLKYRGNLKNLLDWSAFFYGGHAKSELALLRRITTYLRPAEPKVTYLDVGTNVGQHVLFMCSLVDTVIGFEPIDDLRQQAVDNVKLNDLANVGILACALGSRRARMEIFVNEGLNRGSNSLIPGFTPENSSQGRTVDVMRGDDIVSSGDLKNIKIVKIDVEGFEVSVCQGLSATFARDRPFILMELWDFNVERFAAAGRFPHSLYSEAQTYELVGSSNGRYELVPYRLDQHPVGRQAEVLVVPGEHSGFIDSNRNCPYLD
ncbi:MAG: FkbM family methyltransferase [Candidatus Binataceae bacterium]